MQDLTTATFSLWFDADTIEDLATLLSDSDAAVANDCVIQFRSLNSLGFYGDKNGVPLNPTTITNGIVTSNWLHIVWVMTPTNQQIYVNGVQATNAAVAANDVGYHWNGLVIGAAYIGPITWYFNGSIDEIRIYNRALSSDEVQQLYAFEAIPQNCIGQAATATAIVSARCR